MFPDHSDDQAEEIRRRATTGFPSPVEDDAVGPLDLNRLLVAHPAATFFLLVRGDGLAEQGVREGDIILVDRAAPVRRESLAVVILEGELRLRQIRRQGRRISVVLLPQDAPHAVILPDAQLWGVVVYALRPLARPFSHRFWETVQT